MAGGSSDVVPHEDELMIARSSTMLQLTETTRLVELFGDIETAIDELGMRDFIENQIKVKAQDRAWVRVTENRMREMLHSMSGE